MPRFAVPAKRLRRNVIAEEWNNRAISYTIDDTNIAALPSGGLNGIKSVSAQYVPRNDMIDVFVSLCKDLQMPD
jgi:hypothetical protein